MPTVRAYTNVSRQELPEGFLANFLTQVAKSLKREEKVRSFNSIPSRIIIRNPLKIILRIPHAA